MLVEMNIETVGENIKVKYVPDSDALAQCYALGTELAERLLRV